MTETLRRGVLGLAVLLLTGCAGPPPPGETGKVAAKSKRCEHSIGSLTCSNDDEQPTTDMNSPSLNQPHGGSGR